MRLRPYLRPQLDVLFVALNPPRRSNDIGHYFSSRYSRFFNLLYQSGLIQEVLPVSTADEIVFGSTRVNYKQCAFGIVDLVDVVETESRKVSVNRQHVDSLVEKIQQFKPRFVCVIHAKVSKALNRRFMGRLEYGICGALLPNSKSSFVLNYFPNGNNISDKTKIQIFEDLRRAL